jgi:hypothetical protein
MSYYLGASQNVATSLPSAWVDLGVGAGEAISPLRLEIACPTMSFRRALPLACPA